MCRNNRNFALMNAVRNYSREVLFQLKKITFLFPFFYFSHFLVILRKIYNMINSENQNKYIYAFHFK